MNPTTMSTTLLDFDLVNATSSPIEPYVVAPHAYFHANNHHQPTTPTFALTQPMQQQPSRNTFGPSNQSTVVTTPQNTQQSKHHTPQRNPFISRSLCAVCNDKARGCNFGAVTCASCKEFFRRNAFKSEKLKCYFQSKCEINVFSRRFCAACRLLKCYQIGMKSEYIMSEQEKSERQAKIMVRKQSTTKSRVDLMMNAKAVESNADLIKNAKMAKFDDNLTGSMTFSNANEHSFESMATFNSADKRILEETNPLANIKEEFTNLSNDYDLEQLFQPTSAQSVDSYNTNTYTSIVLGGNTSLGYTTGGGLVMSDYSTVKIEDYPTTPSSSQPLQSFELSSTTTPTNSIDSSSATKMGIIDLNINSSSKIDEDNIEENKTDSSPYEIESDFSLQRELESETMRKLLRQVKIIRESNFYQTRYCLLLRTRSSNKCMMHFDHCKLKYLTTIVGIMQAETIQELPINAKHIDLLKIAEILTFNFIKMCKKLHAFQVLSQDDQVALVKGGVMETLIMWSIMNINLERECWEAVDLNRNFKFSLKLELLKKANPKLFEEHRKYALSFEPEWRFDDTLMSLLVIIMLFNEDRPKLSNVEQVKKTRQCFSRLLRTYLGTLYDDDLVEEVLKRLYRQIQATEEISEFHVKAYFDVHANEVTRNGIGSVFMEIFDLN